MATTERELAHLLGRTVETYITWITGTGFNDELSQGGGHLLERVPTGTKLILPAPPTGYINCLANINCKNAHNSNSMGFRLGDINGPLWGPPGDVLLAGQNAVHPLCVSDSDLVLTANLTGTPAEFQCEWHQIKKPEGWTMGMVALTTSYQDIPNIVPISGSARPWPITGATVWNGDSAPVQLQYRLVRKGNWDWTQGAGAGETVPAFTNATQPNPVVLQPGDKFQVKVASITTPGAAWLRFYVEKLLPL